MAASTHFQAFRIGIVLLLVTLTCESPPAQNVRTAVFDPNAKANAVTATVSQAGEIPEVTPPNLRNLRDEGDRYRSGGQEIKILRDAGKWVFVYDREPPDTATFRNRMRSASLGEEGRISDRRGPGSKRLRVLTMPDSVGASAVNALPPKARSIARSEGAAFARPMYYDPERHAEFTVSDRVLLKSRAVLTTAGQRALATRVGAEVADTRPDNIIILRLRDPDADPFTAAARLAARADVEWAEPEFLFQPERYFLPNDPLFSRQQHLRNTGQNGGVSGADVKAAGAWDVTQGDTSIVIAIVDDGVQTSHPDLRIAPGGRNYFANPFTTDPNPSTSGDNHGTAVAGVAAARGNNSIGVSGIAPMARILPIKVFQNGAFTTNTLAGDAIRYAADAGADVINNSWGGGSVSSFITSAIVYASTQGRGGKGTPVFFSSGNLGETYQTYILDFSSTTSAVVSFHFEKDSSGSAGLDMASVDNIYITGSDGYTVTYSETFANGIPVGWNHVTSPGAPQWFSTGTTYQAGYGDSVAVRSGAITHNEFTSLRMPLRTFSAGHRLHFRLRRSMQTGDNFSLKLYNNSGVLQNTYHVVTGIASSTSTISFPASADSAIAVGASTNLDFRSGYSQFNVAGTGKTVDFVAPSSGGWSGVTTTDRTGSDGYNPFSPNADYYSLFGGTSSASPLAAGVAALILSRNPALTRNEVLALLRSTADKVGNRAYSSGWNTEYGFGRLNAEAALNATPSPSPTVPGAPTGVAGVAGNAQVTVSWNAPASNGGATIIAYTATTMPGGATCAWSAGPLSCVVTGLTNGTSYKFTVTATNSAGTGPASDSSTAVTPQAPPSISYAPDTVTYTVGVAISTLSPSSTGGPVTSYAITPNLADSTGLAFNTTTGAVSGTPTTARAARNYQVVATGPGGKDTAIVNITVNAAPPAAPSGLAYAVNPATYTQGVGIDTNFAGVTGVVDSFTVNPALPAGLSLNPATGHVTGVPTDTSLPTGHLVTAHNVSGIDTVTLKIAVTPPAPAAPTITSPTHNVTGVAVPFMVTWNALTAPVSYYQVQWATDSTFALAAFDTTSADTFVVSGNNAPFATRLHARVRAANSGGLGPWSATRSFTLIDAAPSISYSSDTLVLVVGTLPSPLTPDTTGSGPIDSFTVSPALPSGLSLNAFTGVVSGTPSAATAATNHTVTAHGPGGTDTHVLNIAVNHPPPSVSYSPDTVTYTVGAIITPLSPSSTGGPVASFAITPNLTDSTGLAFNTSNGTISGTPTTARSLRNYRIVASGPGGTDTAVVNITVNAAPPTAPSISYSPDTLVLAAGIPLAPLAPDTTGSGPIDSFTVAPALPAGLSLAKFTGTISGTPTVVAAMANYVISAHGLGGIDTETVIITVNDIAPDIDYATPKTLVTGLPIDTLSPVTMGGAVVSYTALDGLPNGLSLNTGNGKITGIPTTGAAAADYRIRAVNSGGSDTATIYITIHGAPVIGIQPVNKTAIAGAAAGFKITATTSASGGALSYQWRRGTTDLVNGGNIAGATSDSLTLSNTALADTGANINVVVTSTLSATMTSTTSGNASLFVNTAPTIATAPYDTTVASGANASISVVAASGPGTSAGTLSYQWRKGTTNLTNTGAVTGATTATLTFTGATIADTAGDYNVVITRTLNATTTTTTSGNAALRVNTTPVITTQPAATQTVTVGANAIFTVAAAGAGTSTGVLSYQWRKNGGNLTNAGTISGATSTSLVITGVAAGDSGSYDVVVTRTLNAVTTTTTSNIAGLTVNAPASITSQPVAAVTLVAGATYSLHTVAEAPSGTLSYQWRKGTTYLTNAGTISGVTTASLTITGALIADTGSYNVVVTRTLNATTTSVTSGNAAVSVNVAPVITTAPRDTTVLSGASVPFSVAVAPGAGSMAGTVTYQWRKGTNNLTDGGTILGATTPSLTITGALIGDTGSYNVVITRTLNTTISSTTSESGRLYVNAAPVISSQPRDTTVIAGGSFGYKVAAHGQGTLTYQWRKDGSAISGATFDTLGKTGVVLADTGHYAVVVTSTLNGVTSSTTSGNGRLYVNAAPIITMQPAASTSIVTGTNITLAVVVAEDSGSSAGTISYQWRKGGDNLVNGGNLSGATAASLLITNPASPGDTGSYSVVITRTLNATTTTTTSSIAKVEPTVSIFPGAFVFRVTGHDRPYTFLLPPSSAGISEVSMSINDIWGRTVWTKTVYPSKDKNLREVTWNGRTANGRQTSAGIYVVRISVRTDESHITHIRKSVSLKPW